MSLPASRNGLVIRYAFLWSHEAEAGATEASKERPAAIVVAARSSPGGDVLVVVAPITHQPAGDPDASVEIPADVARLLGLDGERQWVRLDELNRFAWPGFDLRPVPGRPGSHAYGMLPRDLYEQVRSGILKRQGRGATRVTPRE